MKVPLGEVKTSSIVSTDNDEPSLRLSDVEDVNGQTKIKGTSMIRGVAMDLMEDKRRGKDLEVM